MKILAPLGVIAGLFLPAIIPALVNGQGSAGSFDYYLFVLSWSPEFCYAPQHRSEPECREHKAFVVHGLWPQSAHGGRLEDCTSSQAAPTDTSPVEGIMPSNVIEHEWQAHGTCSGLSGNDYFALIRKVSDSIKIPGRYQHPTQSFTERGSELKKDFEQANPQLADGDIAVQVRHGYLNQVEICISKSANPAPIACSNVNDEGQGTFKVAPVR